jgi:hypothetical protein
MQGITFTECANHLSAQVSKLPDHQTPMKVSGAGSNRPSKSGDPKRIRDGGPGPVGKCNGIHMPDGTVWTGFYSDWEQLSKEDKQTVIDTRVANKAKGGRGRKVHEVCSGGSAKKLKEEIKNQVAELKQTLASLKSGKDSTGDDKSNNDETPDNAGDSFGGRQKKKAKKE